jgi:hypothetical protein
LIPRKEARCTTIWTNDYEEGGERKEERMRRSTEWIKYAGKKTRERETTERKRKKARRERDAYVIY